ncbi:SusC/RagA family TonB-linked outer membrane protein [Imtechella halotolerans]|uniref:SusC/RagA family TonB-linked outer membrane protein n=1 Tax=Imtechella halotolerans TaxID=1165090 RepID=UPI00138A5307|nr:SusC/RagA family TonB-linked outer membrane protein [Imtechella halotolerans]WMQ63792.1 SusC/RagA family TonB-linked outer membrane protein [Imtechella halotolerans]
MKLTFFLSAITLMNVYANSYSQNTKISIKAVNTPIEKILEDIEAKSDYKFFFKSDEIDVHRKVSVAYKNTSVKHILEGIFSKDIQYTLVKQQIILKKSETTSDKEMTKELQQIITGNVVDSNGLPIPGVSVYIKDTNRGTSTDEKGNFTITANSGESIVFSYLGFITQEKTVTSDTRVLTISMIEQTNTLEEVVVISTGYQEISEERATGSYETISKSQIEKPASSISERLVGMVAGLQTTTSANGNISFEIRGQSSLYSSSSPLIVVDGFPVEDGFRSINPNDVESITVLKDAAAASIWGAKSANGVIVITTKKAKAGTSKITISSFLKMSSKLDLDYVVPNASAEEYLEFDQMNFESSFFRSLLGPLQGASVNYLDPYSLAMTAMNEARLGRISNEERDATLLRLKSLDNSKQIKDHLLQAPLTKQYNLNIAGGSEINRNSLSLLFEDSRDFFQKNENNKFLVNFNNQTKITDKLHFDFSGILQLANTTRNGVDLSDIRELAPWDMLKKEDGSLTDMSYLKYYTPNLNEFVPLDKFPYADWSYNPLTDINNRDLNSKNFNTRIQTGLTLDVLKGLKFSSKIQYELYKSEYNDYYGDKTFTVRQYINETSGWNKNYHQVPTQNVPSGGILQKGNTETSSYNFRNQITFNRTFQGKHTINFVGGTELVNRVTKRVTNPTTFGYNDKRLGSSPLLNPIQGSKMWDGFQLSYADWFYPFRLSPTHVFGENTDRFFSVYGNLGYSFKDKYVVTGSYRTDASNLITDDPSIRFNPFLSIGASWNISKEDFFQDIHWVDRLSLRTTYGLNGNISTRTSFKPLISLASSNNLYTGESTASISSFGNPTLRWEKTKTLNLGLDFSIFNRKLHGSVDVYNKRSVDLIVDQSIPSVHGTTSQSFNNGEMLNKGIEVTLGTYLPIKENDIVWSGSFNFAHNDNKIEKFFRTNYSHRSYDLIAGGSGAYVEGYNASTLWSFQYGGLMNVGTEANPVYKPSIYGANGEKVGLTTWAAGNMIEFVKPQGTLVAPTVIGFRNNFKVYDFDLSFILTAKFGHVYRRHSFNYPSSNRGNSGINNKFSEVANGDPNKILPLPDLVNGEPRYYFYSRFHPFLDYLTEDASHIRFQEVSISYSLPSSITEKLKIDSLKFYLQANNLGVFKFNEFGEDPEYPIGTLRPQAAYTFGFNFNF